MAGDRHNHRRADRLLRDWASVAEDDDSGDDQGAGAGE
jgi:hypothetical protein